MRTFYEGFIFFRIEADIFLRGGQLDTDFICIFASRLNSGTLLDLELGNKEAIHVVYVGVEASCQSYRRVEDLPAILRETLTSEFQARINEFHVRALA